jgi:hypothetical protein
LPAPFHGTWKTSGGGKDGEPSWYKSYTFERASFRLEGYPPLKEEGDIELIGEAEGRRCKVRLRPAGKESLPYERQLALGQDGTSLKIGNLRYHRVRAR